VNLGAYELYEACTITIRSRRLRVLRPHPSRTCCSARSAGAARLRAAAARWRSCSCCRSWPSVLVTATPKAAGAQRQLLHIPAHAVGKSDATVVARSPQFARAHRPERLCALTLQPTVLALAHSLGADPSIRRAAWGAWMRGRFSVCGSSAWVVRRRTAANLAGAMWYGAPAQAYADIPLARRRRGRADRADK